MPSALRYITKDSHPDIQQLSTSRNFPLRGRRYDPMYASMMASASANSNATTTGTTTTTPGGKKKGGNIQLTEIIKGTQYAFVSIVDDKPNTLHKVGAANPWYLRVMKMLITDKEKLHAPLSQLLPMEPFQLHTVDTILDISGFSKAGHALDTQGYIAHNDTTIVLAYRCTTSAKDWVTNLSMTTSAWEIDDDVRQGHSGYFSSCSNYACCSVDTTANSTTKLPRVHTGFYNNFLVTVPDIRKYIDPLLFGVNEPPRTLYIVGHSLGAGIAMMAACYFIVEPQYLALWQNTELQHRLRVVTVGGPRACCQSMQEKVDRTIRELRPTNKVQVLQLVRDKDCVPTVPPEMFGFRHLQEKTIYITKEDTATGMPSQVIINPDLRQVIRKKKYRQLLKEQPNVFAPYIVPSSTTLGPTATTNVDNDDDDDDIESVSDTEDINHTNDNDPTATQENTNFDDAAMSETEWLERYNKKIKLIPRTFRDHMPDFYYQPLMALQETVVAREQEEQSKVAAAAATIATTTTTTRASTKQGNSSGVGGGGAVNDKNKSARDETITTTESDEDGIPYQSLNSNESSVYESTKTTTTTGNGKASSNRLFQLLGGRRRRTKQQ